MDQLVRSGETQTAGYRVFISYSHDDAQLARRLAVYLAERGATPLWDKNFAYGHGFHDQIKTFISYSHVFMPILTPTSRGRGWVHQEIGYAMALNIPVLPIAVGEQPGEMLQGLQAAWLKDPAADLGQAPPAEAIDRLMGRQDDPSHALYQSAEEAEHRSAMMRRYADEVRHLAEFGKVRQRGALSSFHIPDKTPAHQVWRDRYGKRPKSAYHCELQRQERKALERHADRKGCKLLIYPDINYARYGSKARVTRLNSLIEFLTGMPDDKVEIARDRKRGGENVTIVGDWFSASSLSGEMEQGYRQTIFTRHGPTVRAQIHRFDEEFDEALAQNPWPDAPSSRLGAIADLKKLVASLG